MHLFSKANKQKGPDLSKRLVFKNCSLDTKRKKPEENK